MNGSGQKNRREFLHESVVITSFVVAGCATPGGRGERAATQARGSSGSAPLPTGPRFLGTVELKDPSWIPRLLSNDPAYTKMGEGRNARQYADLTEFLPKGPADFDKIESSVHSIGNFFVRTETPDLLGIGQLRHVAIKGLVDKPRTVSINEMFAMERDIGVAMLECAGNDRYSRFRLMSAAHWSGVPCRKVFDRLGIRPEASHVLVTGFDRRKVNEKPGVFAVKSIPGASWIFSFDDLKRQKAFFATRMNGAPLTRDHGFPVRLVVPGWYGCASIKWVREISFLQADSNTRATAQMQEFADRTHQRGRPKFYSEYVAPEVDVAAAPIRVEKWLEPDRSKSYTIIGLLWGGIEVVDPDLRITIRHQRSKEVMIDRAPVRRLKRENPLSWQLWAFNWRPESNGLFSIDLSVESASVRTRRLDTHHYRQVIAL